MRRVITVTSCDDTYIVILSFNKMTVFGFQNLSVLYFAAIIVRLISILLWIFFIIIYDGSDFGLLVVPTRVLSLCSQRVVIFQLLAKGADSHCF